MSSILSTHIKFFPSKEAYENERAQKASSYDHRCYKVALWMLPDGKTAYAKAYVYITLSSLWAKDFKQYVEDDRNEHCYRISNPDTGKHCLTIFDAEEYLPPLSPAQIDRLPIRDAPNEQEVSNYQEGSSEATEGDMDASRVSVSDDSIPVADKELAKDEASSNTISSGRNTDTPNFAASIFPDCGEVKPATDDSIPVATPELEVVEPDSLPMDADLATTDDSSTEAQGDSVPMGQQEEKIYWEGATLNLSLPDIDTGKPALPELEAVEFQPDTDYLDTLKAKKLAWLRDGTYRRNLERLLPLEVRQQRLFILAIGKKARVLNNGELDEHWGKSSLWLTFNEAVTEAERLAKLNTSRYLRRKAKIDEKTGATVYSTDSDIPGVAYVLLTSESLIHTIDADKIYDGNGKVRPRVRRLLELLPDTVAVERSFSGSGIHAYLRADSVPDCLLPKKPDYKEAGGTPEHIEGYFTNNRKPSRHYMVLTGDSVQIPKLDDAGRMLSISEEKLKGIHTELLRVFDMNTQRKESSSSLLSSNTSLPVPSRQATSEVCQYVQPAPASTLSNGSRTSWNNGETINVTPTTWQSIKASYDPQNYDIVSFEDRLIRAIDRSVATKIADLASTPEGQRNTRGNELVPMVLAEAKYGFNAVPYYQDLIRQALQKAGLSDTEIEASMSHWLEYSHAPTYEPAHRIDAPRRIHKASQSRFEIVGGRKAYEKSELQTFAVASGEEYPDSQASYDEFIEQGYYSTQDTSTSYEPSPALDFQHDSNVQHTERKKLIKIDAGTRALLVDSGQRDDLLATFPEIEASLAGRIEETGEYLYLFKDFEGYPRGVSGWISNKDLQSDRLTLVKNPSFNLLDFPECEKDWLDLKSVELVQPYAGDYYLEHLVSQVPYVFKDSLPQSSVGLICAPGGTGKGQFSLQLACALAANKEIFGLKPTKRFKTMYISAEDPTEILHQRVQNSMRRLVHDDPYELRLMASNIIAMPSIIRDRGKIHYQFFPLFCVTDKDKKPAEYQDKMRQLKNYIRQFQIDILILDTYRTAIGHQLEENNSGHMQFAMDQLTELARELSITILLIHHTSKGDRRAVMSESNILSYLEPDGFRGSSAIVDSVRWAYCLVPLQTQYASDIFGEIAEGKAQGHYIAGRVAKSNYGKPDIVHYFERTEGKQGYLDEVEPLPREERGTDDNRGGRPKTELSEDDLSALYEDLVQRVSKAEKFGSDPVPASQRKLYDATPLSRIEANALIDYVQEFIATEPDKCKLRIVDDPQSHARTKPKIFVLADTSTATSSKSVDVSTEEHQQN